MNEPRSTESASTAFECACEACVRDGLHEPDCEVHARPPAACTCGRTEQSKGAG
jgi:hypothetical protein